MDPLLTKRLPVHLRENRPDITLASTTGRAYPLGIQGRPGRTDRPESILGIVDFLKVSTSPRYTRTAVTYCNVYAYDLCYLAGVYMPRVWWSRDAIEQIREGKIVGAVYASTVFELNANALFDWFETWASTLGWIRVHDANELQARANAVSVAVIVGRNKNPKASGHINVVIPETPSLQATRVNGLVDVPVQSQAGGTNFERRVWTRWWEGTSFDGHFGMWHYP